jgi:hypothetical protein
VPAVHTLRVKADGGKRERIVAFTTRGIMAFGCITPVAVLHQRANGTLRGAERHAELLAGGWVERLVAFGARDVERHGALSPPMMRRDSAS